MTRICIVIALTLTAAGCRDKPPGDDTGVDATDGGTTDGGTTDGGTDGGTTDGGTDGGTTGDTGDTGTTDGGTTDGGTTDGGTTDGGTTDGGTTDGGTTDGGTDGGTTEPASPYDGFYIGAFTLDVTQGGVAWYEESCEMALNVSVDSEAEPQIDGSGTCAVTTLGTATIELSAELPEGGGAVAGELVYTQEGMVFSGPWEGAITEELLTGSFAGSWKKGEASASWMGEFELGRVEDP